MSARMPELSGPDFLDDVAEAELHNGNLANAEAYRKRAAEWRADQRTIEELDAKLEEMRERLANVQSAILRGPQIRAVASPGAPQ